MLVPTPARPAVRSQITPGKKVCSRFQEEISRNLGEEGPGKKSLMEWPAADCLPRGLDS